MSASMEAVVPMEATADSALAGASTAKEADRAATRKANKQVAGRIMRTTARAAVSWSSRTWGLLDAAMAAGAFALAHLLSPYHHDAHPAYSVLLGALFFACSLVFFGCVLGVYDRHNFTSRGRMAGQALLITGLALAVTCLAFGWVGYVRIGRYIVVWTFLISFAGIFLVRLLARDLAQRAKIRVLFYGPRGKFRPLAAQIRRLHSAFYERPVYVDVQATALVDRRAQLIQAFNRVQPDEVIVMDNDGAVLEILHHCAGILKSGCGIFTYAAYYETLLGQVPIDAIDERGVLGWGFKVGSFHTGLAKRPTDLALAAIGLLVGAPLMLLCALLVRLTSPGPIIYRQVRVGRYGRHFWIYKFRTMRVDAERDGAVWARAGDARVTPVGKFLRKTRFDELPQLFNILRGEMSLVGPRPERPEFVEQLQRHVPHYELRHLVQPGLTGWAQVRFRYGSSIEDAQRKLAYDLYYVRHCGLAFDAAIWMRTLAAMAKGAR
ncbi:MAG: capsular polysaccharide biosynthesis protein [Phycisphaerales bacterium]|nr:capsular polysaccharide biosynthesis protein [Phycisphaerales bacterium]